MQQPPTAGLAGFVLQPTYRIEGARPVVLLYGKLENGETFLIRDDRAIPSFWIERAELERARSLGAEVVDDDRRTLRGAPAARIVLEKPQDAPPLRQRLSDAGIATYEADVRFAYRYLSDRGIRGSVCIRGRPRREPGVGLVFENPDVGPAEWSPTLSVLSLDIETDPRAETLLSVALVGCGTSEVLLRSFGDTPCPEGATAFPDERALLRELVRRVRELDPDVVTGWNVVDFDLAVLQKMAARRGVSLTLGRGADPLRLRQARGGRGSTVATIPGRLVLDGIQLVRGAFVKLESYSLEGAAQSILGRGKTIVGHDRAAEILHAFENDRPRLVEYNRNDAQLVLDILDRLGLLELAVERSRLTGMPPDRVAASIASFDFLYLSELVRRGVVAPSVGDNDATTAGTSGGRVLQPTPGLYRNVLVLDFKSLYPSIIRTFQIDPLGYLPSPTPDDRPIVAPNGAAFRREPGILPCMLDELFPRREAARAAGDRVTSQAIKILMNSFYGVLGTSACRFADPALANAITGFGREILLWCKARIEELGHEVLYGDTDSLFVRPDLEDAGAAKQLGIDLVRDLNGDLARHVERTWQVQSHLDLEFERLYLRLLLPAVRRGTAGARKRYAGLVDHEDGPRVEFTGMEVVRSDWTELARRTQRELYERLFQDRPVEAYVREVVEDLRRGRLDSLLVYRKRLRKSLAAYTASTPPHVAAARKAKTPARRVVSYVMTADGPEPAAERRSAIDHEHYVQRQIRAVAEPVLTLLGLEFDRVVGDDTQLRLF